MANAQRPTSNLKESITEQKNFLLKE